jgi:LPS export ABC transporter permease LptG
MSDDPSSIHMHLTQGSQQELQPQNPDQYEISTFAQTDLPIALPPPDEGKQDLVPVSEMSTRELWYRGRHPEADAFKPRNSQDTPAARARWYLVEFHRRIALPTSCLVLALVGIPLGLSSKKGGKSMGFVLTIALVFLYYFISLTGISLGRSGKIPPGAGVWAANIFFLFAGLVLLRRVERTVIDLGSLRGAWDAFRERFLATESGDLSQTSAAHPPLGAASTYSRKRIGYPLLLDEMILRDFVMYLGMILVSFILLTLVFTFFELLGDIVRNHIPLLMVGQYLLNVTPSMIYLMAPLSVLLAVLTTIGLLQKSNEITAMKATGTSIYRVIFPVLVIAAAISTGLFFFDQLYIPAANQRQETIRNQIKGKPAQTYLRPDRRWIFGEHNTIYYYEFFDPDQNTFANITAFQFDPETFELTGRVHASRAHWSEELKKWVFEQGWARTFRGSAIQGFHQFDAETFPTLIEPPAYFKKEVHQSSEMNYQELRAYIADLQQSGFDVVRLRVQLQKKFAYPLITLVMAVLAVPFSLSAGRQGALTGIAVALSVAIVYFVAAGLFEAMGNASQLPAAMAAWAPDLIFGLLGGYLLLKVPT